jgi:hypothetical protein
LAYHQKHYEILPSRRRNRIYYIVLNNHIKSYKCINFYTYTILNDFTFIWT